MAQQVSRFRVLFPNTVSAEDSDSNDFYFEATGASNDLQTGDVFAAIEFFYNGLAPSQGFPIGANLSPDITRAANGCSITATDITAVLNGDPAGSPYATTNFTLVAANSQIALAPQLAVAIGYRADYGLAIEHGPITNLPSDDDAIDQGAPPTHLGRSRPRGRLRARFYLGPLTGLASQSVAVGNGPGDAVTDTLRSDLAAALHNFLEAKNPGTATQFQAVIWSRRNASVSTASFFYVNEFFASRRNRADTTAARVHNWVHV